MNKIRTSVLTAAVLGGAVLGATQVGGIVSAQTDDTTPVEVPADGEELTEEERQERREARQERREARRAARQANHQEVADLLGVEVEDLREQLRDGGTLAEVAAANGVATSDVVDLIVSQMQEKLDQAVENERLTAEEAAEKAVELEARVQTRVEEGRPEGERGPRGPRGDRGPRGGDAPADATADAGDDGAN